MEGGKIQTKRIQSDNSDFLNLIFSSPNIVDFFTIGDFSLYAANLSKTNLEEYKIVFDNFLKLQETSNPLVISFFVLDLYAGFLTQTLTSPKALLISDTSKKTINFLMLDLRKQLHTQFHTLEKRKEQNAILGELAFINEQLANIIKMSRLLGHLEMVQVNLPVLLETCHLFEILLWDATRVGPKYIEMLMAIEEVKRALVDFKGKDVITNKVEKIFFEILQPYKMCKIVALERHQLLLYKVGELSDYLYRSSSKEENAIIVVLNALKEQIKSIHTAKGSRLPKMIDGKADIFAALPQVSNGLAALPDNFWSQQEQQKVSRVNGHQEGAQNDSGQQVHSTEVTLLSPINVHPGKGL
jgi:hypothetical protein